MTRQHGATGEFQIALVAFDFQSFMHGRDVFPQMRFGEDFAAFWAGGSRRFFALMDVLPVMIAVFHRHEPFVAIWAEKFRRAEMN